MSASDYDAAWDRAEDAGLCRDAVADYAYDVWRGWASPRMSEQAIEDEYGYRCPPVPASPPRQDETR